MRTFWNLFTFVFLASRVETVERFKFSPSLARVRSNQPLTELSSACRLFKATRGALSFTKFVIKSFCNFSWNVSKSVLRLDLNAIIQVRSISLAMKTSSERPANAELWRNSVFFFDDTAANWSNDSFVNSRLCSSECLAISATSTSILYAKASISNSNRKVLWNHFDECGLANFFLRSFFARH